MTGSGTYCCLDQRHTPDYGCENCGSSAPAEHVAVVADCNGNYVHDDCGDVGDAEDKDYPRRRDHYSASEASILWAWRAVTKQY